MSMMRINSNRPVMGHFLRRNVDHHLKPTLGDQARLTWASPFWLALMTLLLLAMVLPTGVFGQGHKYVRTYQTEMHLNDQVPYDFNNRTPPWGARLVNMKTAVNLHEFDKRSTGDYGIKVFIPKIDNCLNCKVTVEVYDHKLQAYQNIEVPDYLNKEGLLYGICSEDQVNSEGQVQWVRENYTVNNCLYDNKYSLEKYCRPDFSRNSDEWLPNYYASIRHKTDQEQGFNRPFAVENHKVIVRITIEEDQPFQLKNENFLGIYIPGLEEITELFDFDRPQGREPYFYTAYPAGWRKHDGTARVNPNFLEYDEQYENAVSPSVNFSQDVVGEHTAPYYTNTVPCSTDKSNWIQEELFTVKAVYEPGTTYEQTIYFHCKTSEFKFPNYSEEKELLWGNYLEWLQGIISLMPRVTRAGIKDVYLDSDQKGPEACFLNNSIRFNEASLLESQHKEEIMYHETVHCSVDPTLLDINNSNFNTHQYAYKDDNWKMAIEADGKNISEYIQEKQIHTYTERLSETFPVYAWLRTNRFDIAQDSEKREIIDHQFNTFYYMEHFLLGKQFGDFTFNNWADALHPLPDAGAIFANLGNSARIINHVVGNENEALTDQEMSASLVIYPNPSVGHVTIGLQLPEMGEIRYEVVSLSGEVIDTGSRGFPGGHHDWEIDLRNKVSTGIYILRIKGKDFNEMKKLVIK